MFFIKPILKWCFGHTDVVAVVVVGALVSGLWVKNTELEQQQKEQMRTIQELHELRKQSYAKLDEMATVVSHWRELSDKLLTQEQALRNSTDDDMREIKRLLQNQQCADLPLPVSVADKLRK